MATVIETRELGKRYRLGTGAYGTLREALMSPFGTRTRGPTARDELWALRDLDLEIEEGEALGIIGRNGAGKSTLLRILTGITEPTEGVARTRGRIGALLEVGTGFHPELTGRENVYLNAALLGLARRETRARFDRIVEFAGVEPFLDTPLKRYSSGMALRLAFAVAAHIEPDIIVIDEVLAVGDAEFQRRCLGRVSELEREGRTAIIVSHDVGVVARMCSRALLLEQGFVRYDGAPSEAVEQYRRQQLEYPAVRKTEALSLAVVFRDADGNELEAPRRDEVFQIEVSFETAEPVAELDLAVYVINGEGVRVLDEALSDSGSNGLSGAGTHRLAVSIPPLLRAGDYTLGLWIGNDYEELFDGEVTRFTVLPRPEDREHMLTRPRIVQPPVKWQLR